jgi:four helix bundle protein
VNSCHPQLKYLLVLEKTIMKNFKELRIWLKGMDIAVNCFTLTTTFPKEEKYGLTSQITKSGISIPSNIAEGSSRHSEKDYSRFIEISMGSAYELETQLLIAQRVNFGDEALLKQMLLDVNDEQKMLMGFGNKLNQK